MHSLNFRKKGGEFQLPNRKNSDKLIELFILHLMLAEIEKYKKAELSSDIFWYKAASTTAFPENGGACVKYKDLQIAVFNFTRRGE
jgi:hypothetical protein